jgi:hypothetical protein
VSSRVAATARAMSNAEHPPVARSHHREALPRDDQRLIVHRAERREDSAARGPTGRPRWSRARRRARRDGDPQRAEGLAPGSPGEASSLSSAHRSEGPACRALVVLGSRGRAEGELTRQHRLANGAHRVPDVVPRVQGAAVGAASARSKRDSRTCDGADAGGPEARPHRCRVPRSTTCCRPRTSGPCHRRRCTSRRLRGSWR